MEKDRGGVGESGSSNYGARHGEIPVHTNHRRHLSHLIRSTRYLRHELGSGRAGTKARLLKAELGAITWALDMLGFPPSRYDEVLEAVGRPPSCDGYHK